MSKNIRIISALILMFFIIKISAAEKPLIHFNFKDASGMETYDKSGIFKCKSNNEPFRMEHGALRSYPDSDIKIPDDGNFPSITNELSISSWILLRNTTRYQTVVFKGDRSENPEKVQFCLSIMNGYPEFKFKNDTGDWKGIMIYGSERSGNYNININIPPLSVSEWNHLAVTFNDGLIKIFINGNLKAEVDSHCKSLASGKFPLLIGAGNAGGSNRPVYNMDGLINDLRIYGTALPDKAIEDIYNSEKSDYPDTKVTLAAIAPEGYDPGFKRKLALTKDYEKNIPSEISGKIKSEIKTANGVKSLFINGRLIYPMQMMPSPYVNNDGIFKSCRDFAAAGMDLYSDIIYTAFPSPSNGCKDWWTGDGVYDFSQVDEKLMAIVKANPKALILIRIKLNPPKWWWEKYPDEVSVYSRYGKLETTEKCASTASEIWEKTYEKMLRDFIKHVESSNYASHIYGYSPAGGWASEWFWYGHQSGLIDYSQAAQNRFKKYVRKIYENDINALRSAWVNPKLDFENVEIPLPKFRKNSENYTFRDPGKAMQVIDYRRFLSDMTSGNIIKSCRICKEETKGEKVTCIFYGYSMQEESSGNDGLHGLKKVLESPYVDMLCSPTSYGSRRGGDEGNFISAYNGSYRMHGKFYWDEADIRTHFYNLGEHGRTSSMNETISVLQRAFGYTLTKGTGMWWFLIAGNALFHHDKIMNEVRHMKELGNKILYCDKSPNAEVALIADEESSHFIHMGNNQYLGSLIWKTYCEAARMGAPFDVYLFDDVLKDNFPKYKVYVFMNCFYNGNGRIKKAAEKLAKDGAVLVWCYAPGYVNDKGFSFETIKKISGINVKQEIISKPVTYTVCPDANLITAQFKNVSTAPIDINPFFYVDDPEAESLMKSENKTLMALKKFDSYSSVYTMVPLTKELLQGLCDYAGVHVYSRSFDVLSANKSFIMLHNSTNGKKTIALPGKYDVTELLSGRDIGKGITEFSEDFPEQTTRIYKLSEPDAKSFFSRVFGID